MMGRRQFAPKLYYQLSLDSLVPQDHLLRRIAETVDFSFIYSLARPHYSHTGQPSVDPVVLFKALLVGYLYGVTSERRLMEEIQVNLAYRWFLGYDLDEAIPDHSVLSKARVRFPTRVFEAFFNQSVELCQAAGLVRGKAAFLDSTLIQANASLDSLESRDGHELPMPPRQYVERLFQENPVDNGASRTSNAGEASDETVDADLTVASAGAGESAPRAKRPPANQRSVSRTDPDASVISRTTFGLHLAYKAHVAVDDHPARVITAALVTSGATADEYVAEQLLGQHCRQTGRLPEEVVADRRYGTLDIYRYLDQLGVRAVIPDRSGLKRHPGGVWSIRDFHYDDAADTYTCAAGETLARAVVRPSERMVEYKAPPAVCQSCRFRNKCSPSGKPRGLRRSFDRPLLEDALRWLKSDEGRHRFKQRQVYVETVFAWAKDRHGMRRAQWRQRWRVQIQVWLTAAAMNLKKLARAEPVAGGTDRLTPNTPPPAVTSYLPA